MAIKETYKGDPNIPPGAFVMDISPFSGSPLSPSHELMDAWWSDTITWKEFVEKYYQEIFSKPLANDLIKWIIENSQKGDIWLVCEEREYPCHRYLIKYIIEKVHLERGLKEEVEDYSEHYRTFKNRRISQIGSISCRPLLLA